MIEDTAMPEKKSQVKKVTENANKEDRRAI